MSCATTHPLRLEPSGRGRLIREGAKTTCVGEASRRLQSEGRVHDGTAGGGHGCVRHRAPAVERGEPAFRSAAPTADREGRGSGMSLVLAHGHARSRPVVLECDGGVDGETLTSPTETRW